MIPYAPKQKEQMAFPCSKFLGMSLRDWFAGQALSAVATYTTKVPQEAIARMAYDISDAMMEERKRYED